MLETQIVQDSDQILILYRFDRICRRGLELFHGSLVGDLTYLRNLEPWGETVCAEHLRNYGVAEDPKVPAAAKPDF